MILKVLYKAIDPYYSDCEQVFIGETEESCWEQKYRHEQWLGRDHPNGISSIYEIVILDEPKRAFL